jgi:SAM-dependent methyltransferase
LVRYAFCIGLKITKLAKAMQDNKEWFSEWFDSPYYHILYKNRDEREAEFFLRNLVDRFAFTHEQKLIDLACGKGRHSIYLNSLGFDVMGVDLAAQSIAAAKASENNRLHFEVQDLRHLPYLNRFDVALNLFTSFGYFDCDDTNQNVMHQINHILKPNGLVVIDFMNVECVLASLIPYEQKVVDGILFTITKKVVDGILLKRIEFNDKGKSYSFSEEVQVLRLADFERLFKIAGFEKVAVYGNYHLDEFDLKQADRLILVGRKNV